MPTSLYTPDFLSVFNANRDTGGPLSSFPSPADWRDPWIYFLMVDRFNNSQHPPRHTPFDDPGYFDFQGGNLAGIQDRLSYIKDLGAGALWLSPVMANVPLQPGTYHGYGIRDFLHVDPRYARAPAKADDELRSLVDAAHKLDLYVILDIVLNHTGDVFAYDCDEKEKRCANSQGAEADFRQNARTVRWRDAQNNARADWPDIAAIPNPPTEALVWPSELQKNEYYRRQGVSGGSDDTTGDFDSLKQFRTDLSGVQQFLIRCHQYAIARWDLDGYRIDTLRYLKGNFAQLFGNSVREYALSIGKKNFFTFGEVNVGNAEDVITRFIGRTTNSGTDLVGVDAALDFPLTGTLKQIAKASRPPSDLVGMYTYRKQVEREVLSSHGDATRYFVTFLDNHDAKQRFRYEDPTDPNKWDDQLTLALACLYCLPGIPCLYYGTEQGFHGADKDRDPAVREALWGLSPDFNQTNPYYREIAKIAAVRKATPALRYGRFYFRPVSGDGQHFGISTITGGVLAFSRILMDQEILVIANTSTTNQNALHVITDITLTNPEEVFRVFYSNKEHSTAPSAIKRLGGGGIQVIEPDGSIGNGPLNSIFITLQPMEVQILGK